MISRKLIACATAAFSGGVLCLGASPAEAFSMNVHVQSIHQDGVTSGIYLGHTVSASSLMNRLYASASYEARCSSGYTNTPIREQRGFSAQSVLGGTQLSVTLPASLPARRVMPGFDDVPGGTTLACSYGWTADAEESTYTVSASGVGMTIGGQRANSGSSVFFEMYQPGAGTEKNSGCIH